MDKHAERLALKRVFGAHATKAAESERPDFVTHNDSFAHGIEITDLYVSATDGKLDNLCGYTTGLLDDTLQVHKKDRDVIRVDEISIERKNGETIRNVRAIYRKHPSPVEAFALLTNVVDDKSLKYGDYLANCDFADLIVCDRNHLFGSEKDKQLLSAQILENRELLIRTPFREVFVLSQASDPAGYNYYPVRGNAFLVDALLLDHLYLEVGGEIDDSQRIPTISCCLKKLGHRATYERLPIESIHIPGWQLIFDGLDVKLRDWTPLKDLQSCLSAICTHDQVCNDLVEMLLAKRDETHSTTVIAFPAHDT